MSCRTSAYAEASDSLFKQNICYLMVGKKKKNINLCDDGIEKSVPPDHCLSLLDKPRDAKRRSSGRILLSIQPSHSRWILISFYSFSPTIVAPLTVIPMALWLIQLPQGKATLTLSKLLRSIISTLEGPTTI